jgi:hypothetical protein
MTLVALVDDVVKERRLDAMRLHKEGLDVLEVDPTPSGPDGVVDMILSASCDAAAVDWQLNSIPGVTYDGVDVLQRLRVRRPTFPSLLWTKGRKFHDQVFEEAGDRFDVVVKEAGVGALASRLRERISGHPSPTDAHYTIAEMLGVESELGIARARFLGLSTEPIEFDVPDEGLPEWAAEAGALARVRVVFEHARLVLTNVERLELTSTPDALEAQLDSMVPPMTGIVAD